MSHPPRLLWGVVPKASASGRRKKFGFEPFNLWGNWISSFGICNDDRDCTSKVHLLANPSALHLAKVHDLLFLKHHFPSLTNLTRSRNTKNANSILLPNVEFLQHLPKVSLYKAGCHKEICGDGVQWKLRNVSLFLLRPKRCGK